ncbi:MAG: hypothetical protein HY902_12730 [Deltaproteobacteria bacterium]|nr:hypothetical protein [Deltaproteobacteria bacterium]
MVAGAALRLAVPVRLVMIFSAYRLTEDAATLTHVPRAGAAPTLLYRLVFAVLVADHRVLVAVNTACALLTLPLLVALYARFRPPKGAVATAAGLLALLPVLVLDARTESHLLPAMLWLSAGLLLLDQGLQGGLRRDLLGSVALLTLAAMSRPELTAMTPLLAAVVAWWRKAHGDGQVSRTAVAVAAALGLLLIVPHLLHLRYALAVEQEGGSLPPVDASFVLGLPLRWLSLALPLQPDLFPAGLTALALWAAVAPGRERRFLLGLLLAAALWMALTLIDLPRTSVPRLHAPAAVLVAFVAAWQVGRWLSDAAVAAKGRQKAAVALGICALSAVPSAWALSARSNEDETEDFLTAAIAQLPARDACVVALAMGDPPPPHRTQRAFPAYLLRPPHRDAQLYSFTQWRALGEPVCAGGTFLVVDHRCYAMHAQGRQQGAATTDATGPNGMLGACRALMERHPWRKVLERDVPNRGDNEYGYYAAVPSFRLGLYGLGR